MVLAAGKAAAVVAQLAVTLAANQGQACLSRLITEQMEAVEAAVAAAGLTTLMYGPAAARVR